MLPKLIITDIDGVWTDGGMYYDREGNEWKKFNTYDSAGVLWCRLNDIRLVVMTGENTEIVQRRIDKLKIEHLYMGVKDKLALVEELRKEWETEWEEIAYLGDDLNDMAVLRKVGFSACPESAPVYVQRMVDFVVPLKGGEGVFRAFVEQILTENELMDKTLNDFLNNKESLNQ